jgi:hypothetical protein
MILIIGKDNKIEEVIEESKFSELGIWKRKQLQNNLEKTRIET